MLKGFAFAAGLAVFAGPAFAGAQGDPPDKAENCERGTLQLIECMERQRQYWDVKLTTAYQWASKDAGPAERDLLRAAERAWIKFRDANSGHYAVGEGSISRVNAAWCMRDMTEKRAKELAESPYPN
jgi:uncharacterized protein YecT (DUF1311 family)